MKKLQRAALWCFIVLALLGTVPMVAGGPPKETALPAVVVIATDLSATRGRG